MLPMDIEKKSFEIIKAELGEKYDKIPNEHKDVVVRVIHTTADFDYADNTVFSNDAIKTVFSAFEEKAVFVTDTNMALAGINKAALGKIGCSACCFMADEDVARIAKERGTTRAEISVEKAMTLDKPIIYVCGNAPTALIKLSETIKNKELVPKLIIAAPVGFVNVVHSKELIRDSGVEYIATMGRKGGSTVAAAICNALMYMYLGDKR